MDPQDLLGTPILTVTLVSVTLALAAAVKSTVYSTRVPRARSGQP